MSGSGTGKGVDGLSVGGLETGGEMMVEASSEAELVRALLAHTPFGLFMIDLQGRVVAANRRGARSVGLTEQEIIGSRLIEHFPPEVAEVRRELGREAITTRRPVTFEDRIGGSLYLSTVVPVFSREGRPTHLAIYGVDITEQRRVARSLEESQRLYRLVAENVTDVVWVGDPEQLELRYVSPSVERLLGISPEAIHGPAGAQLRAALFDGVPARPEAFVAGDPSAPARLFQARQVRPDGATVWVEVSSTLVRRAGDRVELVGVIRDITERRHAEELLRTQRDLALALTDAQDLQQTMTLCFGAAVRVSEADCGGLYLIDPRTGDMDLACHRGLPAESVAAVTRFPAGSQYARRVAAGEPLYAEAAELLARLEDPGPIAAMHRQERRTIAVVPALHEGHVVACFNLASRRGDAIPAGSRTAIEAIVAQAAAAILRATERAAARQLEEQLRRAQRLEALGVLAGGVAHDFNNLLTGIQGNVSLMLADLDPDHPHRRQLEMIEQCVTSSSELTAQLLGFARRGRYKVLPTDMNRLVSRSLEIVGRTRKDVVIETRLERGLWTVAVDRGQMEQVLLNLLVNACQAMPGGGTLRVETANLELDRLPPDAEPGRHIRVSVIDTGTGMDEETRERIFEPFFTTKRMGRGTGLGLASVYGIVDSHRGFVTVSSEVGQGSTFAVHLPATDEVEAAVEAPAREIEPGHETILLVDDEESVLKAMGSMLRKLGYGVLTARNGEEALDLYRRHRDVVALVILDMVLPGLSGAEVYDRLRAMAPDQRVLLVSGYTLEGQAQAILSRGCQGFLQKPFDLRRLSVAVRKALT